MINLQSIIEQIKNLLPDYQQALKYRKQMIETYFNLLCKTNEICQVDEIFLAFLQKTHNIFETEEKRYIEMLEIINKYIFKDFKENFYQQWEEIIFDLSFNEKYKIIDAIQEKYEQKYIEDKQDIRNLYCWGITLQFLDQNLQAIDKFQKCVILDIGTESNEILSEINRAWGQSYFQLKQYEGAFSKYVTSYQYNKQNPQIQNNLKLILPKIKNQDNILDFYSDSQVILGKKIFYEIAYSYILIKNYEQAYNFAIMYLEIEKINSNMVFKFIECAEMFYNFKIYDKTINICYRCYQMFPNDQKLLNLINNSIIHLYNYTLEQGYQKNTIYLENYTFEPLINRGKKYLNQFNQLQDQHFTVNVLLESNLANNNNYLFEMYIQKAYIMQVQFNIQQSQDCFLLAHELQPKDKQLICKLVDQFENQKNYKEALSYTDKLLELTDECYFIYNKGRFIKYLQGFEEALKYYQNLKKQKGLNKYIYQGLGDLYFEQKNYLKSKEMFKKAIKCVNEDIDLKIKKNLELDIYIPKSINRGSEGSGLAVAKYVIKNGGHVTIIGRNQQKLDLAVQELQKLNKKNQNIFCYSADVTNFEQIQKAVNFSLEKHNCKGHDYCVMAAGRAIPGYFLDQDISLHKQLMDVNYFGCVNTTKAVTPSMIEKGKGGKLVYFSSAAACCGMVGYSQYAPSKFALRGLCDSLKTEFLPYNIDVHLFLPSNIDTPGFKVENQTKPIETQEIEGQAQLFSAEQVTADLFNGISKGQYTISNEALIEIARISTDGPVPTNNFFLDLLISPLIIIIRLFYSQFQKYVVKKHGQKRLKRN